MGKHKQKQEKIKEIQPDRVVEIGVYHSAAFKYHQSQKDAQNGMPTFFGDAVKEIIGNREFKQVHQTGIEQVQHKLSMPPKEPEPKLVKLGLFA